MSASIARQKSEGLWMIITGNTTFCLLVILEHHTATLQWKVALCTFEESEASCFQHEGHIGVMFGYKSTVTI